jgi:hypothetical protein
MNLYVLRRYTLDDYNFEELTKDIMFLQHENDYTEDEFYHIVSQYRYKKRVVERTLNEIAEILRDNHGFRIVPMANF